MATGKKKIADLEDEILRLLSESTGSLLDDMNLVNTLQDSKTISEEVTQQLQVRAIGTGQSKRKIVATTPRTNPAKKLNVLEIVNSRLLL